MFVTLDILIKRSGRRHLLIITKAISMQDLQKLGTNQLYRITNVYLLFHTTQYHMINYPVKLEITINKSNQKIIHIIFWIISPFCILKLLP